MSGDLTGKRVLLLSDNDGLTKAIELALKEGLKVRVICFKPGSPGQPGNLVEADGFDLIVLALSALTSEPIVLLGKASLIESVGRVPLLIISDRRFYADLDNQVFHLDFPFDADDLFHKVRVILDGALEPMLVDGRRSRRKAFSVAKPVASANSLTGDGG